MPCGPLRAAARLLLLLLRLLLRWRLPSAVLLLLLLLLSCRRCVLPMAARLGVAWRLGMGGTTCNPTRCIIPVTKFFQELQKCPTNKNPTFSPVEDQNRRNSSIFFYFHSFIVKYGQMSATIEKIHINRKIYTKIGDFRTPFTNIYKIHLQLELRMGL